jgi:hypothetical protein
MNDQNSTTTSKADGDKSNGIRSTSSYRHHSTTHGGRWIPFFQGFLDDDYAKERQKQFSNHHINSNGQPFSFLYTGKRPKLGHRVETVIHFKNCRLSQKQGQQQKEPQQEERPQFMSYRLTGVVTSVGSLPTIDEWVSSQGTLRRLPTCHHCGLSPSHIPRLAVCPISTCFTNKISRNGTRPFNLKTLMDTCLDVHGTLHGQEITTYQMVSLLPSSRRPNDDNDNNDDRNPLPLRNGRIYKVICQSNDDMINKWIVASIEDLTDVEEPPSDLPRVFLL